ncbi:prohead protease/major capsid protein fusion protein [Allorhizobium sp. NPDC080224]|uniref:prohead protease/major capsid protein fusion protein n=1 Tax=Allorhizobium sp. NPDC080224 TaxID=3390547 RepID=UPI003D063286
MTKKNGDTPAERTAVPEMLTRADAKLSSFNAEARTVDLVLATETPVRRRSWDVGTYDEILLVTPQAIDGARLDSMALLDSHDAYSGLDSRLGSVVPGSLRFEGKTAIVTAKISRNPKGEALFRDLEDGHVMGVSVGYKITSQTKTEAPAGGTATIRATRWQPMEISVVSVPADPGASTRSHEPDADTTTPAIERQTMTRKELNAEVRSIQKAAGLPDTWAQTHIDADEIDLNAVRADALAQLSTRSQTTTPSNVQIVADHTDPAAVRSAMADALAHRIAPGAVKLEGRAVEYRSHKLLDMAGDMAIARGERVNIRDTEELLKRAVGAHSTSDFPELVSAAANKALLAQYQIAAPTYRQWAARKPFTDFKEHNFLRVGDIPAFKEIKEGGETPYGTMSSSAEKVTAKEYGTGLAIGRRLLINDDLSALSDFANGIAVRAANDENALAYGILKANPVMQDGHALFSAEHNNLPAGAAFGATTIAAMVKALRGQTSLDGMKLNLQPGMLVVGTDLEVSARTLLTAIQATKTSDVNPWANFAELVVDAELGATEHYLFTSPTAAPTVVYGYVGGAEGPQIRTERDFDTLALKVAANLDFAVGAIDFRGVVKNAGA